MRGKGMRTGLFLLLPVISLAACAQVPSQDSSLVHVHIVSNALRNNLVGDPYERDILVLLPPSYSESEQSRYAVLYYLHGLGQRTNGHLTSEGMFRQFFTLIQEHALPEIIMVAVDGTTLFGGSYYTDSPTIGNFEEYVAEEIVTLIDSLFRTRPTRDARVIAGFSMGGHGALKLAMKHSDVFSQVGSLSGSPLSMRYRKWIYKKALVGHRKPTDPEDLVSRIRFEENWSLAAAYAKAAAFSPNPGKPPLYIDIPFEGASGDDRDPAWQKWLDDDPLSLVSKYRDELATLDEIYLDHGEDETTLGTEDFIRELVRYDIGLTHYVFRGDHEDELFLRHIRMIRHFATRWQWNSAE